MNSLKINFSIENKSITNDFYYGSLYLVLSSGETIKSQLYHKIRENGSIINSDIKEAIQLPIYIIKNRITKSEIEDLKKQFHIQNLDVNTNSLYDQMIIVLLKEFLKKDIVAMDTSGLADHSMDYLIKLSLALLKLHSNKLIILVYNQRVGIRFPEFKIEKLEDQTIKDFSLWILNHSEIE